MWRLLLNWGLNKRFCLHHTPPLCEFITSFYVTLKLRSKGWMIGSPVTHSVNRGPRGLLKRPNNLLVLFVLTNIFLEPLRFQNRSVFPNSQTRRLNLIRFPSTPYCSIESQDRKEYVRILSKPVTVFYVHQSLSESTVWKGDRYNR